MKFPVVVNNSRGGYILSFVAFFALLIVVSIALAMTTVVFWRQVSLTNSMLSARSYYAAESGVLDALKQLKTNPGLVPASYAMMVGQSSVTVTVSGSAGSLQTISAVATTLGISKTVQVSGTLTSGVWQINGWLEP